ncbi:hypothetical protein Ani05nite_56760 [Amorphoplanes nipponensis]|uniref:Uncharacterized protein n=1 Tax=Actinoplanes nipponensis TaxID=135950 RepID=A0A919JMN0_9ACTN|nr:hypothetical protein Ani05nite_56760 [Actinoplanes nipponensis]
MLRLNKIGQGAGGRAGRQGRQAGRAGRQAGQAGRAGTQGGQGRQGGQAGRGRQGAGGQAAGGSSKRSRRASCALSCARGVVRSVDAAAGRLGNLVERGGPSGLRLNKIVAVSVLGGVGLGCGALSCGWWGAAAGQLADLVKPGRRSRP